MDENLIEAIRSQYQFDMKDAVSKISIEFINPDRDSISNITKLVDRFSRSKENASYFEAIVKNLKGEDIDGE